MRVLMVRQKKLLDKWFEEHKDRLKQKGGILWFDIADTEYFSYDLFEELQEINNTEILCQEINRYISDKGMSEL